MDCCPGNIAPDVCDGDNQDCDAQVDEDPEIVWYHDLDGDGFTNNSDTQNACSDPDGASAEWVDTTTTNDCDDNTATCGVKCFPDNPEFCDGYDNNCDGSTDENGVFMDWWPLGGDWPYRKKLTFNNGGQSQDIDNFTVLVKLTKLSFEYLKSDGTDLRFIDDDGFSELNYHIENWNEDGDSFIWVQVTNIPASSSDDYMWMYYGNI
ncbi:MAG: DUF2341 domain-containing protein [Proteobacteria bacterium]|nr:DUF2341 domain-containing protein [Pseudomonadota bacterium]